MAKETVDKIIAAETAAETAEADARKKALDMIEKAKADAAKLINEKCAEAESAADDLIKKAKLDAEEIINKAQNSSDKLEISSDKMDQAIRTCLSKLI